MGAHDAVDEAEEVSWRGTAPIHRHVRTTDPGLPPAFLYPVTGPLHKRGSHDRYHQGVAGADLYQQVATACPGGDLFAGEPREVLRTGQGGIDHAHQPGAHPDRHGQIARLQAHQPCVGPRRERADGLTEFGQQRTDGHGVNEVGHHGQQVPLGWLWKRDARLVPARW
ncbi:hypothetical protein SANT12839_050260 [Streptomyces antimycoticus]|uniref:Uncharacterized protein n=1 Tax=Streptomyces antimycoticus TaxID=68175 RepID=A0A4D4K7R1_9ACTN|nr:hypothetical protein SANT12839_050260 [Streptomyces antimycoticus]